MMRRMGIRVLVVMMGLAWGVGTDCLHAAPIQSTPEYANAQASLAQSDFEAAVAALQPLLANPGTAGAAQAEIARIRLRQAETLQSQATAFFHQGAESLRTAIDSNGLPPLEVPKALYDLARVYDERLNDLPRASQCYGELIQKHANFLAIDKVVFYQAQALEKMNRPEDAARHYQQLVSQYPYSSFHPVAKERMRALAPGTSVAAAAIETQADVVESTRDDEAALQAQMDLARMHRDNGDHKEAIKALRKVAGNNINPELSRKAMEEMATLMDEKARDYKGAAQVLDELVTKFPNEEGVDQHLLRLGKLHEENLGTRQKYVRDGRVYYRDSTENVEKAISYYEQLTKNHPDADESADAYLRKGQLYQNRLNDPDKARQEYENFLRSFPNHPEAGKVKERLRALDEQ